ncbi:MAG: NAD-dependent epimerase/dehydratase family protein [Mucilaginibacter sp.]|nr:NAD-dependent epimerase/dehydratase family protein [Mucilaginibacter sp.]
MIDQKILVIGACGQIGTELTAALRHKYKPAAVIAIDQYHDSKQLQENGPYFQLNILDKPLLEELVVKHGITQIYHLAAMLSATGEQYPEKAWDLNMQSLLNVLEVSRKNKVEKVFWPSSIAVFGNSAPKQNCPQNSVTNPSTVYGISKSAGENWCAYYFEKYGLDVRSIRFPGLISYQAKPGGGTTDYAVNIFHEALETDRYTCFLEKQTYLPMMYMPDAIRATLNLMDTPADKITVRTSYNIAGMSFNPEELAREISKHIPDFEMSYAPDSRQEIAAAWPQSIHDIEAQNDWNWKPKFNIESMTTHMLLHLRINKTLDNASTIHTDV